MAKGLTKAQILTLFHAEGTHESIGNKYGVSPSHVSCIKRGAYHQDITGAERQPRQRKNVTEDIRLAIVQGTDRYKDRASRLGVSVDTIKRYMAEHKRDHPDYIHPPAILAAKQLFIKSGKDRGKDSLGRFKPRSVDLPIQPLPLRCSDGQAQ